MEKLLKIAAKTVTWSTIHSVISPTCSLHFWNKFPRVSRQQCLLKFCQILQVFHKFVTTWKCFLHFSTNTCLFHLIQIIILHWPPVLSLRFCRRITQVSFRTEPCRRSMTSSLFAVWLGEIPQVKARWCFQARGKLF